MKYAWMKNIKNRGITQAQNTALKNPKNIEPITRATTREFDTRSARCCPLVIGWKLSGILLFIESFEDLESGTVGLGDEANLINVKHDDGTEAQYVHLTLNGALKNEGDSVIQGEIIALSGNTGYTTGPHLHFQVIQALIECEDTDPRENFMWYSCNSIPITFKNTSEHCFGLLDFKLMPNGYTAEPYWFLNYAI